MIRIKRGLAAFTIPVWAVPLLYLLIAWLAYGILFTRLGYFWDEWPIMWIAQRLGPEGLALYFETNRPFWGLIYRFTTSLLGDSPWVWQVFGLAMHWLAACGFWMTVRQTWYRAENAALWSGLLFLVYPGFRQSSIAFMYGHFFVAYAAFFWSLALNLLALRRPRQVHLYTSAAILLSLVNLLSLEYFFVLELLRPALLWLALGGLEPGKAPHWKRTLIAWLPCLAAFAAVILWRTVFFPYQTHNYQPSLLARLSADPAGGLATLAGTVIKDLGVTAFAAWNDVFRLPVFSELGPRSSALWLGAILLSMAAMAGFILNRSRGEERLSQKDLLQMAVLAAAAFFAGGLPFWVTDLPVGLGFPNDRFTLPFAFGAGLLVASLILLLPGRKTAPQFILAALTALAVGFQFLTGVSYQRDWNIQRSLFWQMYWRIPALEPGTAVVTSQMPLKYFSDNSLAAPLNWIYDTDRSSAAGGGMDYMFYDAAVRSTRALKLEKGQPILQGFLAAEFHGTSDRLVVFHYQPPACFRILDPEIDPLNPGLSAIMKEAAAFSNLAPIQTTGETAAPQASIFGPEPARGWCYFYQKADLARQTGDWEAAGRLAGEAFASGDYPNDPAERLLFIEIYAHNGDWQSAVDLTKETVQISGLMKPSLARLWERIVNQTADSPERSAALAKVGEFFPLIK